jgi:hypothetical protein
MHSGDQCAPVEIAIRAENSAAQALQFEEVSVRRILPGETGINNY